MTELCLLGSKDTYSKWIKMAMGKPIAALIITRQFTKLITKKVYEKYFQDIGYIKIFSLVKVGAQKGQKENQSLEHEDKARGDGGKTVVEVLFQ